ncbi:MAG: hypothetical protein ACK5BU_06300 [Bacteroidota bacterium]|jgi:hypothetical protein
METPTLKPKETWTKPALILIEVNKIKQEEMENWLRMMEDPEVFRLMELSGPN